MDFMERLLNWIFFMVRGTSDGGILVLILRSVTLLSAQCFFIVSKKFIFLYSALLWIISDLVNFACQFLQRFLDAQIRREYKIYTIKYNTLIQLQNQ